MIHLFSNVFLSTDTSLSSRDDKILLSSNHKDIVNNMFYEEVTSSKILYWSESFLKLVDTEGSVNDIFNTVLNHVNDTGRRVVIHASQESAVSLLAVWYDNILHNNDPANIIKQIRAALFNYNVFTKSSRSDFATSKLDNFSYDNIEQTIQTALAAGHTLSDMFLIKINDQHSVERMIATYLVRGTHGEGIVNIMQQKLAYVFDSFMYDLKEVVLCNITKKDFRDHMGLTKDYDYSNIEDVFTSKSKIGQLLFQHPMWNYKYLTDFDIVDPVKMDDKAIDEIIALVEKIEVYLGNASILGLDTEKLYRVKLASNMKPDDIKLLLHDEKTIRSIENLYFSISLRTVNGFIMDYIIENYENPELLEELILKDI